MIISLITAAMLMLCIVCTICLCRQQKKRERDIKYQADRQVRLAMSQVSKKSNEEALLDGSSLNSDVESPAPRKPASKSQSSRVIETQPLVVVDGDEELNEHKELVITSPTRMNSEIEFSDSDDGEQLDRFNSETRKMGKAAAGLSAGDSFDDGSFVSGSSSSPGGSGNGLTGVAPDASNGAATQLRGTGRADIVEVPASQFTHKNGTAARPSRPFHVSSSGHEDDLSDMDIQERSSK